jgi:hypothetical protein
MGFRYATPAALALWTTEATAETDGIQNHAIQKMFMEQPCMAAIKTIDEPNPSPKSIGMMTMAFGFLMGFEASHPNIRGDYDTILKRLRADCTAETTDTAFEMLQGYAAN